MPQRKPFVPKSRPFVDLHYGTRWSEKIAQSLGISVARVEAIAAELYPECPGVTVRWNAARQERVFACLGVVPDEVVARVVGCDVNHLKKYLSQLSQRPVKTGEWSRDEDVLMRTTYSSRPTHAVALILNRSVVDVSARARHLRLNKSKEFLARERKKYGSSPTQTPMPRWTDNEIAILKNLYPTYSNQEIARALNGRSVKSVVSKAHILGLKKDPDRLREMGRENVNLRRDRPD